MPTPVNPGGKINQKQPNSFANRGSTPMGQQVNLPSGGLNNTSLIPESPRLGSNGKRTMAHDFGKEGGRTSVTPTNVMVDKYKDGFELDKALLKTNMLQIEENPLAMRIFTHVAQTSTAIQVAWSHPANF